MKKKKGIVQPKKFIARLRKDNDAFDNLSQQDAHEFLNYLLNTCADLLKAEMKELKELQRLEDKNTTLLRLNTKNHRILNSKATTNGANNNNKEKNNKNNSNQNSISYINTSSTSSKRNSSANGSNRSLSSQNSTKDQSNIYSISSADDSSPNTNKIKDEEELTWIHELFQGILVNETKCLNCETVIYKLIRISNRLSSMLFFSQ